MATTRGPAKIESRICFAIYYFKTKRDAVRYDAVVRKRGDTYNGGFFDGMACGRDERFDHKDPELGQLYAVTTR
jgi:hypothetical protein